MGRGEEKDCVVPPLGGTYHEPSRTWAESAGPISEWS